MSRRCADPFAPARPLRAIFAAFAAVAFAWGPPALLAAPVLFATQTPDSADFTTVVAVFGNHRGSATSAARGGHLWIRYDDGTLRNLTAEAGFGQTAETLLAVREPCVHWDGTKALFSMVVGGTIQNDLTPVYFQIYEVSGLAQGETVSIVRVPQPENFNNVSPAYAPDDRIVFTTDMPRGGDRMHYPQLDEYESAPVVSGLWIMNPDGSDLHQLDHAPSGDFRPIVDSFGRIVFSRWDHLQRDQQADADIDAIVREQDPPFRSFTFASEESGEFGPLAPDDEVFPEPRRNHPSGEDPHPVWDPDYVADETEHNFNLFLPWTIDPDGTDLEILNHLGRHEFVGYIQNARDYLEYGFTTNPQITSFLSPVEHPTTPGRYYGIDAPEFATHASGQIFAVFAPEGRNADDIAAEYVTHPATRGYASEGEPRPEGHVGMFRDPMIRSDGSVWAAHSTSFYADRATATDPGGSEPFPLSSRYDYSITRLVPGSDGYLVPGEKLIPDGVPGDVSYFDNGRYRQTTYSGLMWELYPVEVVARPRPPARPTVVPPIETAIMMAELGGEEGVRRFLDWMRVRNLGVIVSRDVTRRGDRQQDFNLKVAWSDHQSVEAGEQPARELAWFQIFEGRALRGYREPERGRRLLARPLPEGINARPEGAPSGAVRIGDDGSVAAFVPARRALSWQTTEMDGQAAVRERYWLTVQPGEVRTCTNCHGLNRTDVFGNPPPENPPQAFVDLVRTWRASGDERVLDYLLGLSEDAANLDLNADGVVDAADHFLTIP